MQTINPIKYWKDGADDAWDTAEKLFNVKKYHYSLFFSHLALEKVIKAIYIKSKNEAAPIGHNLVILCKQAGITLDESSKASLREISKFNISARYDDYKLQFYKKATKVFTQRWIKKIETLYNYFLSLLA